MPTLGEQTLLGVTMTNKQVSIIVIEVLGHQFVINFQVINIMKNEVGGFKTLK